MAKAVMAIAIVAMTGVGAMAQQTQKPEPAAPPAAVAGKWAMALEIPQMGTANTTLDLKQDGEKITGTYTGSYGTFQLEGTVKARVLEFWFTMTAEGTAVQLSFKAEVAAAGDAIVKGTGSIEGMGDVTWSAKRSR